MEKIDVVFSQETIDEIRKKIPRTKDNLAPDAPPNLKTEELRRLVENAIRAYLQLKIIAKDKGYVTVMDADKKAYYTIDLE